MVVLVMITPNYSFIYDDLKW